MELLDRSTSRKRIIFTRFKDRGVTVTGAAKSTIRYMTFGGKWKDQPRGFIDTEIERRVRGGHSPDSSLRYCRAMMYGGLTEAEAWAVLRDHDCMIPTHWAHHGEHHELIDISELPNKWFRDAWTRSRNGGPIVIDQMKAREIQWWRINKVVELANKDRQASLFGPPPIEFKEIAPLREYILKARDEDEIARVWPENLPRFAGAKPGGIIQ